MTYQLKSGDQFVAIAVGGGGPFGEGDHVMVFRLPGAPADGLLPSR